MTIPIRKYNTKDVDMVITIETIIDAAIANRTFLQTKRPAWAGTFFEDIKTKINVESNKYLGADAAKQLREATQTLIAIQEPAITELSEVKIQIEVDFDDNPIRKKEILIQLGYTSHFKEAQKRDQEGLINLLYQFKTNLTPELKAEIVAKGTNTAQLETIIDFAITLKEANVTQEGFKGTRTELTVDAINALNGIYTDVIGIAKIASRFYAKEKTKKDLFSFNKISKKLNFSKVIQTENPPQQ
ncbi:hypothetical protein [Flavobacterium sp.]